MNLILLGGNSIQNKEWIEEVGQHLASLFESTRIQYYQHWNSGTELIDLDEEVAALQNLVKDFPEYIIFAKSVGTLVVRKGIQENFIKPTKCIFVGTPILWEKEKGFGKNTGFENYSVPTLFIQKTSDPMLSFEDLSNLLKVKNVKNYTLKEIQGDDHHYEDLDLLRREVEGFIK